MIRKLRKYMGFLQDGNGSFLSENVIKSTAEYLLVHRFYPEIAIGNTEKARNFLQENLPFFAWYEVGRGFHLMERILQIAVGIPEDTLFLSEKFLNLSTTCLPVSVKSSLLLVLFLQKVEHDSIAQVLREVIEYQKSLRKTVSKDSLYETTHNLMTFQLALERFNVRDIILSSCEWLCENVFSYNDCIDLMTETAAVTLFCQFENEKIGNLLFTLENHQNKDGGFPVFAGGKSEFHSSLASLWALIAFKYR